MSRLKGPLVLVALVAFGGFAGLWFRRQGASPTSVPDAASRKTPAQTAPQAPAPDSAHAPRIPRQLNPKASLLVRLRCSGKPVAGIPFTLMEEASHQTEQYTTGPDGAHQIQGLPAGEYHVGVEHPDYVSATASRLVAADKSHEVVIELDRGGRLEGRVTDAAARPLEGVHVYFLDTQGASPGSRLEAKTDASGQYRITGLPPGTFEVRFQLSGYRVGRRPNLAVAGKGQEFRIDMVLIEGRSISGRVVHEDGTPIPGATVVGTNEEVSTCRADEKGTFSLVGLGDGLVSAFASAAGYGPVYLKGLAPGSSNVEFRLSKAAEVLGRVSSKPIPERFLVRISRFEQDLGTYVPLYSRSYEGAQGDDFRMTELPAGRYRLEVQAPGFETQDVPELDLSPGQVLTGVQIRLRKTS